MLSVQALIDAQRDQLRDDASFNGGAAAEALRRQADAEQAQKEAAFQRELEASRALQAQWAADRQRASELDAQHARDKAEFRARFGDRTIERALIDLADAIERLGA